MRPWAETLTLELQSGFLSHHSSKTALTKVTKAKPSDQFLNLVFRLFASSIFIFVTQLPGRHLLLVLPSLYWGSFSVTYAGSSLPSLITSSQVCAWLSHLFQVIAEAPSSHRGLLHHPVESHLPHSSPPLPLTASSPQHTSPPDMTCTVLIPYISSLHCKLCDSIIFYPSHLYFQHQEQYPTSSGVQKFLMRG